MPLPVSRMNKRVTFRVKTDAATDVQGAVREGFAASATVWCSVHSPNELTRLREGRYASPVTLSITLRPHDECVAGNQATIGGVTYAILGIDDTATDAIVADLSEII